MTTGFRINTEDGKYAFRITESKNNKSQPTKNIDNFVFSDLLANVTKSISSITLDQVQANPAELLSSTHSHITTFFFMMKNNKPVLRRVTSSDPQLVSNIVNGLNLAKYNVYKALSCYTEQKYKVNMYELFKSYLASNSLLPLPIQNIPDSFDVDYPLMVWLKISNNSSRIFCKHLWLFAKPINNLTKTTMKRSIANLYANASSQEDFGYSNSGSDCNNDNCDKSPKRVRVGGKQIRAYNIMVDSMGAKYVKVNKIKVKLTDIKGAYRYTTPLRTHIRLLTPITAQLNQCKQSK